MMREDFCWFLNHYDELYKRYGHKHLVIKNEQVLGAYESVRQALDCTDEEPGTYIVQECNGNASAYSYSVPGVAMSEKEIVAELSASQEKSDAGSTKPARAIGAALRDKYTL